MENSTTKVNLMTMPFLSIDYSNVIDFENYQSRDKYFVDNTMYTIEANIKYDGLRHQITVNQNLEYIRNFDYLWFVDGNNDKKYFYFIVDSEYTTRYMTTLHVKLDVWQTYLFEYQVMTSFVERCHVNRWNGDVPTYNVEDEGLEKGEIVQFAPPQNIATMGQAVIITSSVPMGYVPGGDNSQGGGGDYGSAGNWREGKLSSKGFRFIKGMEGYGFKAYQDSGGIWTVGYGVTKMSEPDVYDKLVSMNPMTEEACAKESYKLKNERYGSKIINACLKFGVTKQYQFDALLSLGYNAGTGVVTGDNELTRAIANDINDKEGIKSVWENFRIRDHNGTVLEGLKTLRREQAKMFFGEEFEIRKIIYVPTYDQYVTENDGNGWLPEDSIEGENGGFNGYKSFDNDYGKDWLCPVKGGTVTSKYGWRVHPITGAKKFHNGTDIAMGYGKPTVASKSGTISQTGYHDSMGNYIYIDCGAYRVKYMHLSKIIVSQGDTVKRGDKVGEIGSTGSSTGPHCHWEIVRISDGDSTDPAPSLRKGDKV